MKHSTMKRSWNSQPKVKGSLLINALLALFVSSMAYMLLANNMHVLANSTVAPWQLQNAIDIALLQQRLVYASDISVEYDRIQFTRDDKTWELKQIDDHLVLTPGSQYFASHIDTVHFAQNGSLVEMTMIQGEIKRTIPLIYVD